MTASEHTVRIVIEHVDVEAAEQRRVAAEEQDRIDAQERLQAHRAAAELRLDIQQRAAASRATNHHRRAWRRQTMRDLLHVALGAAAALSLVFLSGALS